MSEEEKAVPNIYQSDSTKALLGLAFALIYEIKHHQGFDERRFVNTLRSIATSLKPETPGLTHLMKTFEKMIENNVVFENKDDSADKA